MGRSITLKTTRLLAFATIAALSSPALSDPYCDEQLEWGYTTVAPGTSRLGDLNNDGVIDTQDLALLLDALATPPHALDDTLRSRADLTKDGSIGLDDLTKLLQLIAGQIPPLPPCRDANNCCALRVEHGGCCGTELCQGTPTGPGDDDGLDPGGGGGGPGGIGGGDNPGGGPDPIGNPPGGGGGNPPDCVFYITPDFPIDDPKDLPATPPQIPFIGIDYLILTARKDITTPPSGQIEWYLIIDGHDDNAPDFFGHTITFQPKCLLSHYEIRALTRKSDGSICHQAGPVELRIHRAMPRSVAFGGANHTIHHDATGHAYDAPHWLDFDRDGQITAPPQSPPGATGVDRRFPIAYTRNTPMTIADFETHFSKDAFGNIPTTYTIKGTGSDGSIYTSAPTIPYAPFTGSPLPDHIAYLPNYTISWKISFEEGQDKYLWFPIGTTTHEVYATLNDPADTSPFRHSVYRISCGAGDGSSTVGEALSTIWLPFQNRSVTSASGHTLGYYRNDPCGFNTAATDVETLLRDTSGQCLAWTELYGQCLSVQGISSHAIYRIDPLYLTAADWDHPQCPDVTFQDSGMIIADPNFPPVGGSGCAFYPFRTAVPCEDSAWNVHDVVLGPSMPGQDNPTPPGRYIRHFVVRVGAAWYDPSYGLGPILQADEQIFALSWKQAHLRGFYTFLLNQDDPDVPFAVSRTPAPAALDVRCMPWNGE